MAGQPVRRQFLRKYRGHGIALLRAFRVETLKRRKIWSLPQVAASRQMRVYFLAVARDVLKALLGAVSTLAAVLARSDLLSLQIVGGLGQAAECRLTIRSSRRRFAARLNSGVSVDVGKVLD